MGSADTGAREPQDSVSALGQTPAEMRARAEGWLHNWERNSLPSNAHLLARDVVALSKEVERLALAAGVGVPPDGSEDLVSAPAKERQDARAVYDRFRRNEANLPHLLDVAVQILDDEGLFAVFEEVLMEDYEAMRGEA